MSEPTGPVLAGPVLVGVDLQPVGRRAQVAPGSTVLEAAQASGVQLVAVCGGVGTCGTCRVRAVEGELGAGTAEEEDWLTVTERGEGWRLACQAKVIGAVRLEVPPESLSAPQRLQTEGVAVDFELDPPVMAVDLVLLAPSLDDLRADATRLRQGLAEAGVPGISISLRVAGASSGRLRAQQWQGRAAVGRRPDGTGALIGVQPVKQPLLGLAVDTGTTKLAAYLVDLASGRTLARAGAMNPQIAYGEDVVTRVTYANTSAAAAQLLHERLVGELDRLVGELCAQAGAGRDQIVDAVVVGNTVMHHFVTGLPVRQLGEAPYISAVSDAVVVGADEIGLQLAGGATVYLPPNIAAYVGSDHVAMLLATGLADAQDTVLGLDIGTNTEISLAHRGAIWSCSTASGPAFEGAHIHDGMR
ncbi:MAG: 2Fe-2S iron-sulfur cluster-binding protein, partial [Acidimicrobiales bacterium]